MTKIQSFKQYVESKNKFHIGKNPIPKGYASCNSCQGEGKGYRWEDRDVIEGFKLANKYPCTECDGKGIRPASYLYEKYTEYVDNMTTTNKKIKDHNDMVKSISKKLTAQERSWLSKIYDFGKST